MDTKKVSRNVQKRLKRKGIILSSSTNSANKLPDAPPNSVHSSASAKKEKKKKPESSAPLEVKSDGKPTAAQTNSKRHHKHHPKDKVVYNNTNYVSNDTNDVGGFIQSELRGMRKQSKNIKSASDLTENQAHVVKRQITKLHGADLERKFKRPKHCEKTLDQATSELAQFLNKQKTKMAASSKSTNL